MENQIIPIFAVLSLTVLSLHLLKKIFYQKKLNPPPGPKPWPVIGNLNLIGPLPHHSLHRLSQKYGPIMLLKFGSAPVVVGSSVAAAKIFLKTMDLTFASWPMKHGDAISEAVAVLGTPWGCGRDGDGLESPPKRF
ncbi:hypothetical protein OROMI_026246 [Orobanche minor]